jgi:exonuclease III
MREIAVGFRLVTLNLNGIRSAADKGFLSWAEKAGADCMCVQEVRAQHADVAGRFERIGALNGHFHFAQKKGSSGVGVYARRKQREAAAEGTRVHPGGRHQHRAQGDRPRELEEQSAELGLPARSASPITHR